MTTPDPERLRDLEIKFAFLEKHVETQDRAMFELAERVDVLEARLKLLREKVERRPEDRPPEDERPPHY